MKNERGFTLIELLAMLVILGILMGVTIPNITGIIGTQRVNSAKADAENLIERAKTKVSKDQNTQDPGLGTCIILTLDYLNDNDDYDKGAYGGTYDMYNSFVLYTKEGTVDGPKRYKYYVRLVEVMDNGKQYAFDVESGSYHLSLLDEEQLNNVKSDNYIIGKNYLYDLSGNKEASALALNLRTDDTRTYMVDKCGTILADDYHVSKTP